MLGTVLRAFILSHLVLTVGSTFIPILQNWKLRHRKDKDLPRSPGGGVAEPGREPQLTDPRVCALAPASGARPALRASARCHCHELCEGCVSQGGLGASLALFYLLTSAPQAYGCLEPESRLTALSVSGHHSGHINRHCLECGLAVPAPQRVDDHFNTHLLVVTLFMLNAASPGSLKTPSRAAPPDPFRMGIWASWSPASSL